MHYGVHVKVCYFETFDEQSLPALLRLLRLPLRLLPVVEPLVAELEPAAVVGVVVIDFGYEIGR